MGKLRRAGVLLLVLAGCAGQSISDSDYRATSAADVEHHYVGHEVTGPTPGDPPGTGTSPGTTKGLTPNQGAADTPPEQLRAKTPERVWIEQTPPNQQRSPDPPATQPAE